MEAYTAYGEGAVTGTYAFTSLISKIRSNSSFILTPGFIRKVTPAFVGIIFTGQVFLAEVKNLLTLMWWGEWMVSFFLLNQSVKLLYFDAIVGCTHIRKPFFWRCESGVFSLQLEEKFVIFCKIAFFLVSNMVFASRPKTRWMLPFVGSGACLLVHIRCRIKMFSVQKRGNRISSFLKRIGSKADA